MSKFRALAVSALVAATLFGGAVSTDAGEAKAPVQSSRTVWCC